jgi:hypothetical protein
MLTVIRGTTLLRLPSTGAALAATNAWHTVCITAAKLQVHTDCSGVVFVGAWQDSSTRMPTCGILLCAQDCPATLLHQRIFYYFPCKEWKCQVLGQI